MSTGTLILDPCLINPTQEYYQFCAKRAEAKRQNPPTAPSPFRRASPTQSQTSIVAPTLMDRLPAKYTAQANPSREATVYAPVFCRSIGLDVEKAVRHHLALQVKLDMRRVVRWRESRIDGNIKTKYKEVDGVHFIDHDTLCLYEIKFLTTDLMHDLVGKQQLAYSAWILKHAYRTVRKRLVYVGYDLDRLCTGLSATAADDVEADFGVIWITPTQVEAAADSLGVSLPLHWWDIDSRYGVEPFGVQTHTALPTNTFTA